MSEELDILKRRLEREKRARKEAERVLELKSLELFRANEELKQVNSHLEEEVELRNKRLVEGERRYRQLVENVPDIIYKTNPQGIFTYVNPIAISKTGYSKSELLTMSFQDLILPEWKETSASFYAKQLINREEKSYFEFPIRSKEGELIWIGQNVQFQFKDNRLEEAFAIARDITEAKFARERLELSEEKYRSIIENLRLGLLETDPYGTVTKVYPKFTELTGYTAEELIGKDPRPILLDKDEAYDILNTAEEQRRQGNAGVYENSIKTKDGRTLWVLISAAPIKDREGNVTGTIGVHFDITDRKHIEEALRLAQHDAENARKAEQLFLANMSHEIRTPLNAVIGMSHLLYDLSPTEQQLEYLKALQHSAMLLKGIVNDILDISKIEAGRLEYNEEPIVLAEVIESFQKTFELKLQGSKVQMRSSFAPALQEAVLSDQLLLNQVLTNLLSNAEKFTEEGCIELKAEVLSNTSESMHVEFHVSDSGIGIAPERLKIIFEKYEQANQTTKMKYGGTGLGLAISKKIADFLDGTLEVESIEGSGSTFKLNLKFEKAKEQDKGLALDKERSRKTLEGSFSTILIAEDNAMNRKYVKEIFRNYDLNIDYAHDGRVAVEMCQTKAYDIILMDLQMPEMDGINATINIRHHSNPNKETPIIALSAYATEEVKNRTQIAGMNGFLAKPFTPKQLKNLLNIDTETVHTNSDPASTKTEDEDLDRSLLTDLYGEDADYAFEMFDHFLRSFENQMEVLNKALVSKDLDEIRRFIHKIKPGFSMVGLPWLQELGSTIETAAETGNSELALSSGAVFQQKARQGIILVKREHQILQSKLKST